MSHVSGSPVSLVFGYLGNPPFPMRKCEEVSGKIGRMFLKQENVLCDTRNIVGRIFHNKEISR